MVGEKTKREEYSSAILQKTKREDYTKNYSFAIQNEVQSLYYFSISATILVHITMWRERDDIMKQTHFDISNNKDHDSTFVQHCFLLYWNCLVDSRFTPEEH